MKYEIFKAIRHPAHTCHRPNGFMIWWHRIKPGDMVRCKVCLTMWFYEGNFGVYDGAHQWHKDTGGTSL